MAKLTIGEAIKLMIAYEVQYNTDFVNDFEHLISIGDYTLYLLKEKHTLHVSRYLYKYNGNDTPENSMPLEPLFEVYEQKSDWDIQPYIENMKLLAKFIVKDEGLINEFLLLTQP